MPLSHTVDLSELGYWLSPIGDSQSDRPRASLRNRVSKTPSARGSTEAACQSEISNLKSEIHGRGRGRQAMHLPCKQADAGALPADSTNFE